jgi:hypothetical protein
MEGYIHHILLCVLFFFSLSPTEVSAGVYTQALGQSAVSAVRVDILGPSGFPRPGCNFMTIIGFKELNFFPINLFSFMKKIPLLILAAPESKDYFSKRERITQTS